MPQKRRQIPSKLNTRQSLLIVARGGGVEVNPTLLLPLLLVFSLTLASSSPSFRGRRAFVLLFRLFSFSARRSSRPMNSSWPAAAGTHELTMYTRTKGEAQRERTETSEQIARAGIFKNAEIVFQRFAVVNMSGRVGGDMFTRVVARAAESFCFYTIHNARWLAWCYSGGIFIPRS